MNRKLQGLELIQLNDALRKADLTLAQAVGLSALLYGPQPVSYFATLLGFTTASGTQFRDKLLAMGLVSMGSDSEDRRKRIVSITKLGTEAISAIVLIPGLEAGD